MTVAIYTNSVDFDLVRIAGSSEVVTIIGFDADIVAEEVGGNCSRGHPEAHKEPFKICVNRRASYVDVGWCGDGKWAAGLQVVGDGAIDVDGDG